MMLVAARGWRRRVLIVVAGGLVPVGYEIFRMGYYGLLYPGTALAKDASGSQMVPRLCLSGQLQPAVSALGARDPAGRPCGRGAGHPWPAVVEPPRTPPGYGWVARRVQSPSAVVIFMVVSGLLQAIYWIRQGGDFMHGRVLLTPLFCLVAPVAVIPMALPDGAQMPRGPAYLFAGRPACCGWRLRCGHCGRPIRPAWDPTPPASPTPASSMNAGSIRRPPATRIR